MYQRFSCLGYGAWLALAACGSTGSVSSDEQDPPRDLDAGNVADADTMDAASTPDAGPDAALDARTDGAGGLCADGIARGVASSGRRNIREISPTTRGVAVCPNGDVFVSTSSATQVLRVPLTGAAPEVFYQQGNGLFTGLACDDQGRLFAADLGASLTAGVVIGVTLKNSGISLPNPQDLSTPSYNDTLAVKGVGLYASDPANARIVLWTEQNGTFSPSVATGGADGANGLALGKDGRLYVALTSTFPGADNQVVSYAIGKDGVLSDRQSVWTGPHVVYGITLDENGDLYLAFYDEGLVVRAHDNLTVATATHPAELVFRGGTLLFTDYDQSAAQLEKVTGNRTSIGHLYAVDLAVCGAR